MSRVYSVPSAEHGKELTNDSNGTLSGKPTVLAFIRETKELRLFKGVA
jgi:hypothetical protein